MDGDGAVVGAEDVLVDGCLFYFLVGCWICEDIVKAPADVYIARFGAAGE